MNDWTKILIDEPITVILKKCRRKKFDVPTAARGMEHCNALAEEMFEHESFSGPERKLKKEAYLSKSILDALVCCKGGYKSLIEISESSPTLSAMLDRIEKEFGGSRITLKRVTAPEHAEAADKLIKARAAYKKKLGQHI